MAGRSTMSESDSETIIISECDAALRNHDSLLTMAGLILDTLAV
ncbi:hypothetical protein ACB092_04G162200 [Castanea dentata]